jgi:hypothetical protein
MFSFVAFDRLETDLPQTVIVFVGKMDQNDVSQSDYYVERMKKKGIYLSIIGIQPGVDLSNLDKLADYSYVFDLSRGVPTNIQDIILQANGCNA